MFALKKNLNFLLTAALYLLHRAPKINKMSDDSSVSGEIMQEIGRALRFAETRGPARQRGCRGSERGTARRGTRRWPRRGNAGARCTHARERTWIKIIGCYGDGRQMMLFADSLMAPCQIMRCCGNSSSGPASSSLQLQLSERYSEEKKKIYLQLRLSCEAPLTRRECERLALPWLLRRALLGLPVRCWVSWVAEHR